MKRALLLIVVSAALMTMGFAQTQDTSSTTGNGSTPAANNCSTRRHGQPARCARYCA
jgi:hypothetical protein